MKKEIFISYRRKESSGYSRLIYERLQAALPECDLFMDVEDIQPGEQWREVLSRRIESADVVLVLIGPDWLDCTDDEGRRRLEDPADITRWEITCALERGKRIIPVLLGGASPIEEGKLPKPLAELEGMQAATILHETFDAGIETLIERISGRGLRDILRIKEGLLALERARRWLIPAVIVLSFSALWIGFLDLFTLDTRSATWSLALADTLSPPKLKADIALIAVPERFETRGAQARATYAELISELADAGATSVLLDLYIETEYQGDENLSNAVESARASGTEVYFGFNKLDDGVPRAARPLAESASALGLICVGRRLGYTLIMPLAFNYIQGETENNEPDTISSLPSLALLGYAGTVSVESLDPSTASLVLKGGEGRQTVPYSLLDPVREAQKGCLALAADSRAAVIFLRLSPIQLLRGEKRRVAMDDLLSGRSSYIQFKGRTVIIGQESRREEVTVAQGLQSQRRYGYELYADAINTIAGGLIVQPLGSGAQIVLLILTASAGAWLGVKLHKKPASLRRILIAAVVFLYFLFAVAMVAMANTLIDLSYHLFALIIAYLVFRHFSRRWLTRIFHGGERQ